VIFTTDHGVEAPRAKWTLFDPGIEIAFMIRWPAGALQGGKRLQQVQSNVHLTPTLLELCGITPSAEIMWDGQSQAAWLRGENTDTPCEAPFFGIYHNGSCRCVRTDRYKLIRTFGTELEDLQVPIAMEHPTNLGTPPKLALYDLVEDPLETVNLAHSEAHRAIRDDLDSQLYQWLTEVDDHILRGAEPTPYYMGAIADLRETHPTA